MPGGNGVHVESLKRGDIVFNASQTKDLIEHGKASGRGKVAYASGTAKSPMPALVKATEEPRKVKTGNPKIVKSTNGKGHVEIVNDNNWVDKVTSAVTRMGQEISQALDTPDDNTNTWSDDYAQIHLLNDQSAAIQANTAATQNNTKVKNQEATYVDFAEKVMNRLSKATARLQNRITEFTTYTFKKNTLRAELDSLADEIAAASAALPVYAEYLQMLRNTPIQHESSSDGGGGGGSDSGSDSGADDTAETNAEEAATRLETAKSNLKAAKQNLKDNYKLSDEQKKKLKNNKKIDDSEIKGQNKKNAASVYNDALKQYKQLKKQEDTATETTAKETSKAAKNTEKYTAETAQTSSQTSSNTGAIVSSADAVRASGYDIASYTALGAEAGSDTVTILQTIAGQIAGLSTQIADISVNVNVSGGSASVSSGGGGSKKSGGDSDDDDDSGNGAVDNYSWSKKNQKAIENGEKIDISTIDPSKKDKIKAAKQYNKSLKNGGGSGGGNKNSDSGGNVKSKSGDGDLSVSSGGGSGKASPEEKQFKKEMKAAAKEVKNSYSLTSNQKKAIKNGETLSTKGITDSTKKDAFKTYNQAVKQYNNAKLSRSVTKNNDLIAPYQKTTADIVYENAIKSMKKGSGGGGVGGFVDAWAPGSGGITTGEPVVDPIINDDYLGVYADFIEDNNLVALLGLDKDLAAAIEEYDGFYDKLEDTKDALEKLYQQVVSVWDEMAQAPLQEADRQIEQLELGIDGLTAALGRLDSAMAGGSTLNVLDTIRETEKVAADYTANSQAVLDAIRDINADKTKNAAQQVEIRRWAVDEAKQVLDDAQKAMDEIAKNADEKIAEYKKTREEVEKKLAEAESAATIATATVARYEENEEVKKYNQSKLTERSMPWTTGWLQLEDDPDAYKNIMRNDYDRLVMNYMDGPDARPDLLIKALETERSSRTFYDSEVINQYTKAVEKASVATAKVTAQQTSLREATLALAQAELDKTLREEMQAEILQQAKLAYDQAQTALAQAESEYAAQYIQEVVDNFSAVEEAFESVLKYQKSLDENEELYVKNAEERGNRITAAMRQFQSGNIIGQTATLRAEIAALNEELSGDRLVYGSKEWNDLMSQILDKETELNDLLNQQHGILLSILSDVKEHYSVLIDHLEQVNKLNDAWIDTARAIGDYETELSYIQRYTEQQEMVALYLQQSADAQEQFNSLVASGELIAGTDEYIAKQTEVLNLINDAKSAQNDLREIEADRIKYTIERYEELLDRVDNYVDIIKTLGGLISEAAKFDYDTGNLTDMGQASIAIEMTAWQENTEQLRDVLEERQRLRDEFAKNPNFGEKEFAEALDANDKQIQEYLSNINGAADNIVEIGITIAEKQLAAINKTIDARRKALQLEQDYYNYDKSLKNSTKDIELLNAQIRALDGVTDAESRAMKARLEAQRDELQDNLNDQVREHVVNLQTEGLTEMQEQLADNLDEWRNELQGDIQKQLDYVNSINMSASNIEAALNKLVLGASNGVATLSDVETAVKENGLLTSTVSDVNKQYEEGHAKAVATKQAQDAGAELAARIQGAINTLGTSVSTANIDKFTKEWASVTDKANYNIGSTDQTGKDIQALINQLKSDVSQNQSMKNWVDAIAAVKSPTYNYSQAQIDAMAKSGNVAKQGYNSVITNAKAVWDKMSAEQKKAYNEIAGAFHAGKTVDQMLATYTNAVDSLNKAVATNVEKAKAEMARKAAEEAKRKAEEEAKRRAAEEAARKKAEEEARKKAEEEAKRKAEEEAKRKAEEEAKKNAQQDWWGRWNSDNAIGDGYSNMLYGVQSTPYAPTTGSSKEKVYVLTPKGDYNLKEGEILVDTKKSKKKATGTRHAQKGMTLTQEKGGEIITTKDGVLVPLKAGDGVIPANLTDKLFRMAMDYPRPT